MSIGQTFNYKIANGKTTIRLDEDSLDYQFHSSVKTFQGTLPYENLHFFSRVKGGASDSGFGRLVIIAIFLVMWPFIPDNRLPIFLAAGIPCVTIALIAWLRERASSHAICVQIQPSPFGFYDRLPVPDNPAGQAFLDQLEPVWRDSLKRRFLDPSGKHSADEQYVRVRWLTQLGVISKEEGEARLDALGEYGSEALVELLPN